MTWAFRLALTAIFGLILVFVGIGMPDHTIWEAITLWPGFVLYFIGLIGGMLCMAYIDDEYRGCAIISS